MEIPNDLRIALVLREQIAGIVSARDLVKREVPRLNSLLEPEVGCRQMANSPEALPLADAQGNGGIRVDFDGHPKSEVPQHGLSAEALCRK